jgi:chromosome partitioning protein
MSVVISIANQKGGVGKTTTAINLSASLAHLNQHVLLIDMDPQGNAGRGYGVDVNAISSTTYEVLSGQKDLSSALIKEKIANLDILPSNLKLAGIDTYFLSQGMREPFFVLKKALESVRSSYDFIIIDCPPSLGLLNLNALVASDSVIIPVQCEYFALEAVGAILSSITKIQSAYNPDLKVAGFLLTMYDPRTSLDTEIATQVRSLFKENTFTTSIPRNVSLPEASARGEPVTSWRPSSQGAMAYSSLAREVMERHEARENH